MKHKIINLRNIEYLIFCMESYLGKIRSLWTVIFLIEKFAGRTLRRPIFNYLTTKVKLFDKRIKSIGMYVK